MGNVEIVFWDVQHGHATYIKSPNGKHIMIDLGSGDYSNSNIWFSPIEHLKNNYKVSFLDYLIITHPHIDHIDDILNLDLVKPKVLARPKSVTNDMLTPSSKAEDKSKIDKYWAYCAEYCHDVSPENDPSRPENNGGLKFTLFFPKLDDNNINNHSIVTVLEYVNIKVIIPGDNERSSLQHLMQRDDFKDAIRDADILLAPHHGRESAYDNGFVNLVNPRLTIVSDGRYCDTSANQRYSQKSRGWDVFKNGSSQQRKCLSTNNDGAITVTFGADSLLNVKIQG